MYNGNPNSNFSSVTPQGLARMKSGMNNFGQAFAPNQTMINRVDFRNPGNLIHNNLGDNIQAERISEYTIWIDGNDRSKNIFKNPFCFITSFGGINTAISKEKNVTYGTPGPFLQKKFKNVKYIKLNYAIIPRTNIIDISGISSNPQYTLGSNDTNLDGNKFLILRIKEIKNNKMLSTNDNVIEDCFILYPDRLMGSNHSMWIPTNDSRVYPNSSLFNLDRMTISIEDSDGNQLEVLDNSGNTLDVPNLLTTLTENKSSTDPILINFKNIEHALQINIELTIGVVELEMNTLTNFPS
jgi:hypothetical protein